MHEQDDFPTWPDDEEEAALPAPAHYTVTRRMLHLLQYLVGGARTRTDIFAALPQYYYIDHTPQSQKNARRMLERDRRVLEDEIGFRIAKQQARRNLPMTYHLITGSGPTDALLLSQTQIDTLATLYTLFADPAQYLTARPALASTTCHHPFAARIRDVIDRCIAPLPPEHRERFQQIIQHPFLFLNLSVVTDYANHEATIESLIQAIRQQQPVQFNYAAAARTVALVHAPVDPYYIQQIDGHLYLLGYAHQSKSHLEYRVDRIIPESITMLDGAIDQAIQRAPILFRYWADEILARGALSERWLSQTIERSEVYLVAGQPRTRILVRAQAYSAWRILQQMHRYGDRVELVEPPELRERMRQEVAHTLGY